MGRGFMTNIHTPAQEKIILHISANPKVNNTNIISTKFGSRSSGGGKTFMTSQGDFTHEN